MRMRKVCWSLIIATVLIAGAAAAESPSAPPGFTPLFNGRDLAGWYGWGTRDPAELQRMSDAERADYKRKSIAGGLTDAKGRDAGDHLEAHWKVVDGVLVNDGRGLYLTSDRDFGDFELLVDYAMQPLGDSGVYLRGIPQVQIWDWTEEKKFPLGADKGSGGLWNNTGDGKFPVKRMDRPFGEWNTLRIKMIGEQVTVWLNGEMVVDAAPLDNFFARQRKAPEPQPAGFMPDPVPARGPIQLQTHGSEIRWRNVFLREIPPAEADRELASRDAEGFVELVNGRDLTNWRGAVDAYEIHDSAIQIEVRGQRIKVTLNGTKILDVDLATLDRKAIAHPPKGLDRTRGHVGFSGHNDPVEFRSFKIKRL